MAILDTLKKDKKKEEESVEASSTPTSSKKPAVSASSFESILARPHITEKASALAENNVYVFEVERRANKTLVKNAVKDLYKVDPIKVNIINSPSKNVTSRGIKGVKSGKKKALVYLKKGDTIEII